MARTFALLSSLLAVCAAFAPGATKSASLTPLKSVPLANGAMSFNRVCREWRCKYTGDKSDSASLEALAGVLEEALPELKKLGGATVNRLVCGSCLDFKVMTTVDLDAYGPWEESGHAPEADVIAKMKAIDGVSMVETQTITNMLL